MPVLSTQSPSAPVSRRNQILAGLYARLYLICGATSVFGPAFTTIACPFLVFALTITVSNTIQNSSTPVRRSSQAVVLISLVTAFHTIHEIIHLRQLKQQQRQDQLRHRRDSSAPEPDIIENARPSFHLWLSRVLVGGSNLVIAQMVSDVIGDSHCSGLGGIDAGAKTATIGAQNKDSAEERCGSWKFFERMLPMIGAMFLLVAAADMVVAGPKRISDSAERRAEWLKAVLGLLRERLRRGGNGDEPRGALPVGDDIEMQTPAEWAQRNRRND